MAVVVDEPEGDSPAVTGAALRIRVIERRSRRSLADFGLTLGQGPTETSARTGADGTAETAAVWAAGSVSVRHRPDARDLRYDSRWQLEPEEIRIAEGGPHTVEATLTARRPELTLAVTTVGPDGESLPGAEVELVLGWRGSGGRFLSDRVTEERTDVEGTARFPVFLEDSTTTSLLLQARHREGGLASAVLPLDPPLLPGPWVLVLLPTGSVRVLAYDRAGRPMARGTVTAISATASRAASTRAAGRIVDGACRLEGLGPGAYRIRVFASEPDDVREVRVDVEAGRESRAEAHFDDGTTDLAVAGRVVDENGRGLAGVMVWCESRGQSSAAMRSAEDGRFAFVREPAPFVVVGTERDVTNDEFAPSASRVSFGTRGVILQRVARSVARHFEFLALDAVTGEPPEDGGGIYFLMGEPRSAGGWRWERLSAGRVSVDLGWRPGVRYRAVCPGYRSVEAELARTLDPDEPIRLNLRRGFARTLSVFDAHTGAPLEAARVYDARTSVDARTDRSGLAQLESRDWPTRMRVERAGYHATSVHLDDLESVTDRVLLEPIAGDR